MKKTKKYLLATSGSTVDGREVKPEWLKEIASSYDPKTYGARLNIEHIKGFSGEGPFRAYGDVMEVSTEDVTVNFNGTDEVRTGLYGVFEVTEDAEKLNQAGQKLYPSIEIAPNFAEKGFAYLMGCALTDTPAAIGTERMEFNRKTPGALSFNAKDFDIAAAALEFAGAASDDTENTVNGAFASMKKFFDKFNVAATGSETAANKAAETQQPTVNADMAELASVMQGVTTAFTTASEDMKKSIEKITNDLNALRTDFDKIEDPKTPHRPQSNGTHYAKTDC